VEQFGGRGEGVWEGVGSGDELYSRLRTLPGYGEEKAKIFVAILGKRFGVRPAGWQEAAGKFGDDTPRSVADITDPTSLGKVREWKKAAKAAPKGRKAASSKAGRKAAPAAKGRAAGRWAPLGRQPFQVSTQTEMTGWWT
jgi:hypothetical protein